MIARFQSDSLICGRNCTQRSLNSSSREARGRVLHDAERDSTEYSAGHDVYKACIRVDQGIVLDGRIDQLSLHNYQVDHEHEHDGAKNIK